jgi:UDP-N-acetylmuramate dehydrogenase
MRSPSKRLSAALKGLKRLEGKLLFDVPMAGYATMGVGGRALCLYQPNTLDDLTAALKLCKEKNIKILVIGAGSNIIVSDGPIERLVIKLNSKFFTKIETAKCPDNEISCGAGASLARLCSAAEASSFSGCEFLVGIPGTVGGAIIQNAGAFGSSIADIIKDVKLIDKNGTIKILTKDTIRFEYRKSGLKDIIILGAAFRLKKDKRADIQKRISGYIRRRLTTQDYTAKSAGCVFKNPDGKGISAGALIDRCGLKGTTIGGASVSKRHANFIINRGSAKAKDILQLMALIKKRVKEKFRVSLEEEVEIIR